MQRSLGMRHPVGLLLTNVGTPDAPTPAAVRRYLREFLWDRRVVDLPRPLWWLVLHLFVLPFRSRRSASAYAKIWAPEGSPLLLVARHQADALEKTLRNVRAETVHVAVGMGYGNPSIRRALEELRDRGCRHVLVLPLYPQYSSPTTGSTFDAVAEVFRSWRWVPELRMVGGYHDHPAYIAALANSVREFWERNGEPERLLVSFHGLPERYHEAGDPYRTQCERTTELLTGALALPAERWTMSFQSRFGREAWLRPYTAQTLRDWGGSGVESADVVCPGFSADCLETLEEIAIQNRRFFLESGGKQFRYIPALNARSDHVDALANLVTPHLKGWTADLEDPERAPASSQRDLASRRSPPP
ncbi:MAG: ferrochelatase [Candidatus Krumholzibacteriia bacterium]